MGLTHSTPIEAEEARVVLGTTSQAAIAQVMSSDLGTDYIGGNRSYATGFYGQIYLDGSFSGAIDLDLPLNYEKNVRVTALHSLNAKVAKEHEGDLHYVPMLKDFPMDVASMATRVTDFEGKNHKFAVVYDGWFDGEVQAVKGKDPKSEDTSYQITEYTRKNLSSRAYEILGYDMALEYEDCDIEVEGPDVVAHIKKGTIGDNFEVPFDTAIMDIYKALGKYSYDLRFAYTQDDALKLKNSPIQEQVSVLLDADNPLDTSEGKTWVWISRSNRQLYNQRAIQDFADISPASRLVSLMQRKEAIKVDSLSSVLGYNSPDITLGQFCIYVKHLMELYGEPVLTEQEEMFLVQLYGNDLPMEIAYDPSYGDGPDVFEAVKYLTAKGILRPSEREYNWKDNLLGRDMLEILTAVKDKDSRYTFKDVQITCDAELAAKGFFRSEMSAQVNPVISLEVDDVSLASYFNYLIPADEDFGFKTSNGTLVLNRFCLRGANGTLFKSSKNGMFVFEGYCEYNGKLYYNFRIKAAKSKLKPCMYSGNSLYITTYDKTLVGHGCKVTYGGGVYSSSGSHTADFKRGDKTQEGSSLVDYKLKKEALSNARGSFMTDASESIYRVGLNSRTFQTDLQDLKWNGNDIDLSNNNRSTMIGGVSFTLDSADAADGVRYLTIKGADRTTIQQNLGSDPTAASNIYEVYRTLDGRYLVHTGYLKAVGLINGCTQINAGDDGAAPDLMLQTEYDNVYVLSSKNVVVAGSVVYDIPIDTIMCQEDENGGGWFVDYRAVFGWSTDFLLFRNKQSVSLSIPESYVYKTTKTKYVYLPYSGSEHAYASYPVSVCKTSATSAEKIILSGTNYLSNYLLFITAKDADSGMSRTTKIRDYLFVFKLKQAIKQANPNCTTDKQARKLLRQCLGVEAPKSMYVYAYALVNESKNKNNPKGLTYSSKYGYLYNPRTVTADNWVKSYMHDDLAPGGKTWGVAKCTKEFSSLPFVKFDDSGVFYNVNLNVFKEGSVWLDYGTAPGMVVKGEDDGNKYKWAPNNLGTAKTSKKMRDCKIITAPVAIIEQLLDQKMEDSDINENTAGAFYLGTMPISKATNRMLMRFSSSTDSVKLGRIGEDFKKVYIIGYQNDNAHNVHQNVYALVTTKEISPLDEVDDETEVKKPKWSLGIELENFDWEKYKFERLIEDIDDGITIFTMIVLNFIPRIAIFLFIGLIGLSTIHDVRLFQTICDKYFDIFKIVTFGRMDVHTINVKYLLVASIAGIAVFFLFMDGTVINLFAWLSRFFVALVKH